VVCLPMRHRPKVSAPSRLTSGLDFEQDRTCRVRIMRSTLRAPTKGLGRAICGGWLGMGAMGLARVTAMMTWIGAGFVGPRATDNSLSCPAGNSTRNAAGPPKGEWDTRPMRRVRFVSTSRRPPRARGAAGLRAALQPTAAGHARGGCGAWRGLACGHGSRCRRGLASTHTRGPARSSVRGALSDSGGDWVRGRRRARSRSRSARGGRGPPPGLDDMDAPGCSAGGGDSDEIVVLGGVHNSITKPIRPDGASRLEVVGSMARLARPCQGYGGA
jgi:hypothetical protein